MSSSRRQRGGDPRVSRRRWPTSKTGIHVLVVIGTDVVLLRWLRGHSARIICTPARARRIIGTEQRLVVNLGTVFVAFRLTSVDCICLSGFQGRHRGFRLTVFAVRCSLVESTHASRTAGEIAESSQWLGLPSPVTRPCQWAREVAGASGPVAHNYKGHPWEATQVDRMRRNRGWGRLDRTHSRLVVPGVA